MIFGLVAFGSGEWQAGLVLAGAATVAGTWYVALIKVHICNGFAPTAADLVCGNARRGGLLRGCHLHPWWRLKQAVGMEDPADIRRRKATYKRSANLGGLSTIVQVNVHSSASSKREILMLWATVVGSGAGVLSLIVGGLALAAQLQMM